MSASAVAIFLLTLPGAVPTTTVGVDAQTSTVGVELVPERPAQPEEASIPERLGDFVESIEVHGFISQGAIKSSANNYLGRSHRGTLGLSEVGINFSKQLLPDLRAGVQLFARHLDGTGDFSANFDWFYLDYRFRDWLALRAGRMKVPFGLYNEFNDIDAGRVPILLPNGVYPTNNRDYLLAQIGAELYGYVPFGVGGSLEYRAYGGTFVFPESHPIADGFRLDSFETPYVLGARVIWNTPLRGLRLAGSGQVLRIEANYSAQPGVAELFVMLGLAPPGFNGRLNLDIPAVLWLVSAEFARDDLLVTAEYGRWHVSFDASVPTIFPPTDVEREQFYVMASYRFHDLLWPSIYYAALFPDISDRSAPSRHQHDVALTFRLDLNDFWLLKIEGHYLDGTAYLDSVKNEGVPLDELTESWWLFVARTTLYF